MRSKILILLLPVIITLLLVNCKKSYNPPVLLAPNNYLVADGFINLNSNESTVITLSRSKNLVDTVISIVELNAQVNIEDHTGASYHLADTSGHGNYESAKLNLSQLNKYRLKITTADGHQYLSDFVTPKKSQPIDSLTWEQDKDVTVFVNTHDATNSTIYYKWDYVETWETYAPVQTFWVLVNGLIFSADTTNQTDSCWSSAPSNTIITGTSVALGQDVISHAPITMILKDNEKIKVRYSIAVRQIPLTVDAYNYWIIIQKNSQQLGTLFDLQPSQLTGNIHPITNPDEPVIGYVTAAATQQKRLFIDHHQLTDWSTLVDHQQCDVQVIPTDPNNFRLYDYPDTAYAPWYFTGSGAAYLLVSRKVCVDCREYGGINKRPSFW
jgi:hypothetical protein